MRLVKTFTWGKYFGIFEYFDKLSCWCFEKVHTWKIFQRREWPGWAVLREATEQLEPAFQLWRWSLSVCFSLCLCLFLSTMKVIFVFMFVSVFFFVLVFVFVFVPFNYEGDFCHCICFLTMHSTGQLSFTIFAMFEKFVLQAVFLQRGLNTATLEGM